MSEHEVLDERSSASEDVRIRETLASIPRDYGRKSKPGERPSRPRLGIGQRPSAQRRPQSRPLVADERSRPQASPSRRRIRWWALLGLLAAGAAVVLAVVPHGGGDSAAAERAEAGAINLRSGDLPGYAVPAQHDSVAGRQIGVHLQRCLGIGVGQRSGPNDASSPTFTRGSGLLTRQVVSDVTEISGPAGASDFALVRSGRVTACLKRGLNGVTVQTASGLPVRISGVRVNQVRAGAPGAKASFDLHVAMSAGALGQAVPVYLDLIGYAVGDDEVSLVTLALAHPFPARTAKRLSSLLVRRARQVGAAPQHRQVPGKRGAGSPKQPA
jgi:hypothetical protein